MTTKTLEKTAAKAVVLTPATVLFQGNLAIDKIKVKPQVRKRFDDVFHKELTESVRTKGLIQSLVLRPDSKGEGVYELVAGERRLRAAIAAKMTIVPVRVLALNDEEARIYQVEENIHRRDLTPIEEAKGLRLLLDAKNQEGKLKYTTESLAQLVDKKLSYVYRALALLELPAGIQDAIDNGTLTKEHGHQILRVPASDRDALIKLINQQNKCEDRVISAKELTRLVDDQLGSDLKHAPWAKDKEYAGKPACSTCPMNSGNQGALFDGVIAGRCMATACFDVKMQQAYKDQAKELTEKYPGVEIAAPQQDYEIQRKYQATELDALLTPAVLKAIKTTPAAFVACMTIGNSWRNGKQTKTMKPQIFVRKSGHPLIYKALGPKDSRNWRFAPPRKSSYSSDGGRKAETPKQRFVRRAGLTEVCKTFKPKLDSAAFWKPILKDLRNGYSDTTVVEYFKFSSLYGASNKDVKVEDMPKLAFLIAVLEQKDFNAGEMKAFGFNLSAAMKKGKAEGEKEWERLKAEKEIGRA